MSLGADRPGRLAILVHEVRSPVAALGAIAEAAGRDDFEPTALVDVMPLAVAACRGIERIVRDIAVASVRLEHVDVEALVAEAVAAASLSGARVRADVQPGLPPLVADPVRLRQALDNLVSNALLHGSREDEVVVSATSHGARLHLAVADVGEGIAPEDQSRIFESGVRLDGGGAGAGLGLTITRAIAEAHGGKLTMESAPGRGSTFTIALPLRG